MEVALSAIIDRVSLPPGVAIVEDGDGPWLSLLLSVEGDEESLFSTFSLIGAIKTSGVKR